MRNRHWRLYANRAVNRIHATRAVGELRIVRAERVEILAGFFDRGQTATYIPLAEASFSSVALRD
jgi:hypothetical protein